MSKIHIPLIKNLLKQNKLPFVLSIILNLFLFAFASIFLFSINNYDTSYEYYWSNYYELVCGFIMTLTYGSLVIATIIASILGATQFFYLFKKDGVDFYHSLPVRREKLFIAVYIKGLIQAIVPYIIVILTATIFTMILLNSSSDYNMLIVLLKGIFIILFCYNIAILITLICANVPSVILNTAGIFISLSIILTLLIISIDSFFAISSFFEDLIYNIFISLNVNYNYNSTSNYSTCLTNTNYNYFFVIFILLIGFLLSLCLFIKRKSESNNMFFAFSKGKIILKTLYTIAFGYMVFMFIDAIVETYLFDTYAIYRNISYYFLYFTLISIATGFFMFTFYCFIEFIATRSLKELKRSIKFFPISFFAIVLSFLILGSDIFGIRFYFPNQDKITSYSLFYYNYSNNTNRDFYDNVNTFDTPENLNNIENYFNEAKSIIKNNQNDSIDMNFESVNLKYDKFHITKNNVPMLNNKESNEGLDKVYSSEEYKENYINAINVYGTLSFSSDYYTGSSQELKDAILMDIEADQTFSSYAFTEPTLFRITASEYIDENVSDEEIYRSSAYGLDSFSLYIKGTYTNTIKFLEENGTLDMSTLKVYTYELPEIGTYYYDTYSNYYLFNDNIYSIIEKKNYSNPEAQVLIENNEIYDEFNNTYMTTLFLAEDYELIKNVQEENNSILNDKIQYTINNLRYGRYNQSSADAVTNKVYNIFINDKLTSSFVY